MPLRVSQFPGCDLIGSFRENSPEYKAELVDYITFKPHDAE